MVIKVLFILYCKNWSISLKRGLQRDCHVDSLKIDKGKYCRFGTIELVRTGDDLGTLCLEGADLKGPLIKDKLASGHELFTNVHYAHYAGFGIQQVGLQDN